MPTRDVDKPGDASSRSPPRRRRILSAVLWGIVGGLSVVVLVQAWLLVGGTMPVSYGGVLVLAGGVAVTADVRDRTPDRPKAVEKKDLTRPAK